MYFKIVAEGEDKLVYAVSPRYGNDASLVAVFNHLGAAKELVDILNHAANQVSTAWGIQPNS